MAKAGDFTANFYELKRASFVFSLILLAFCATGIDLTGFNLFGIKIGHVGLGAIRWGVWSAATYYLLAYASAAYIEARETLAPIFAHPDRGLEASISEKEVDVHNAINGIPHAVNEAMQDIRRATYLQPGDGPTLKGMEIDTVLAEKLLKDVQVQGTISRRFSEALLSRETGRGGLSVLDVKADFHKAVVAELKRVTRKAVSETYREWLDRVAADAAKREALVDQRLSVLMEELEAAARRVEDASLQAKRARSFVHRVKTDRGWHFIAFDVVSPVALWALATLHLVGEYWPIFSSII